MDDSTQRYLIDAFAIVGAVLTIPALLFLEQWPDPERNSFLDRIVLNRRKRKEPKSPL
jgi:hypothetical protein